MSYTEIITVPINNYSVSEGMYKKGGGKLEALRASQSQDMKMASVWSCCDAEVS